jgi:hypothetical protein
MKLSPTEIELRTRATQSALNSVRLAGLEPSPQIERLLADWTEGKESLDSIRDRLTAPRRTEDE